MVIHYSIKTMRALLSLESFKVSCRRALSRLELREVTADVPELLELREVGRRRP